MKVIFVFVLVNHKDQPNCLIQLPKTLLLFPNVLWLISKDIHRQAGIWFDLYRLVGRGKVTFLGSFGRMVSHFHAPFATGYKRSSRLRCYRSPRFVGNANSNTGHFLQRTSSRRRLRGFQKNLNPRAVFGYFVLASAQIPLRMTALIARAAGLDRGPHLIAELHVENKSKLELNSN